MSSGKAAARDLRWGRQGGRWAEGEDVDVALEGIADLRAEGIEAGTWPGSAPVVVDEPPALF